VNAILSALADACRREAFREKVLVVPSLGTGYQLLEALSFAGVPWLNVRPATAFDLAKVSAATVLFREKMEIVTPGQAIALLEEALAGMAAAGELRYFAHLHETGDLARLLHGTIQELRLAGLTALSLDPRAFVSPLKGAELKRLLCLYEAGLRHHCMADQAEVFRLALQAACCGRSSFRGSLFLIPAQAEFPPLAHSFLARLSAGARQGLPAEPVRGLRVPSGCSFSSAAEVREESAFSYLYDLPACRLRPEVEVFHAYGAANEVREVFRRLKTDGLPLDSAVLIHTSSEVYLPLLHALASGLELPVTFAEGLPVRFTRPGRLARQLLHWLGGNYAATYLCRILAGGEMNVSSPERLARILRRSRIGWGRDRYLSCLKTESQKSEVRNQNPAADPQSPTSGEETERLKEILERLFAALSPTGPDGLVHYPALVRGLSAALASFAHLSTEADREALKIIQEGLAEAAVEFTGKMPEAQALTRLRRTLGGLTSGASAPKPGALHVISCHNAWLTGRTHAFVVGLNAEAFPGAGLQDPVLLDGERCRISGRLSLRQHVPARKTLSLVRLLASHRGRIILSYPSHQPAEGQPSSPSGLLLQAWRLAHRKPGADYSEMLAHLPPSAGYMPDDPAGSLTADEWWASAVLHNRHSGGPDSLSACYPGLAGGLDATAARSRPFLTPFDGLVTVDPAALDPRQNPQLVLSATQLESLAACPFNYFLSHVLRVRPPDELEFDPGTWLDSLSRGSLLHDIYCRYLRETHPPGGPAATDKARLLRLAGEMIEQKRGEIPPPGERVFEYERNQLLRDLEIFFRLEEGHTSGPAFFEVPFGDFGPGVAAAGIGQSEPVTLALPDGSTIRLRGRIDRIDRGADGHWEVWDYKTGSAYNYSERAHLRQGRELQHALYGLAAEVVLRQCGVDSTAQVRSAGTSFPRRKGKGNASAGLPPPGCRPWVWWSNCLTWLQQEYFAPPMKRSVASFALTGQSAAHRPWDRRSENCWVRLNLALGRRCRIMTRLLDREARLFIRTELDTTFLVEAGAGSGKTTSLVDRMAALVVSGRCNPENLAAVTFTRKAAGELRERFQARCEQLYRAETDINVKSRLDAVLASLDRVFLGTIHSFSALLLRERPLEAGLSPDFTEVEGMEEQGLLDRAWEEYLTVSRLLYPERLHLLEELDVHPRELKSAYSDLALYPDVQVVSVPAPYPDLSAARAEFYALLERARPCLPDSEPDKGWDKLQAFCRLALRAWRIFDLDDDRRLLRVLERLGRNIDIVQNRWPCRNTARQLREDFIQFRDETAGPLLAQWRRYRHQPLLGFLLPAVDFYNDLRARENKVNFQDLLLRLADLLRDNREVREYFASRYTHLLVDEFQDTDPIQAQIMLYLTGSDTAEKEWTKLVPRPGALFVVGDPKQSIYRFRRADIDIYNQVRKQIEDSGGRVLRLTANFRSLPEIVTFANTAFSGLLSAGSEPYQAAFTPMQEMRRPVPAASGVFYLPVEAAGSQEAIAEADARNLASWIRHCLDSGLPLSRAGGADGEETVSGACPEDFMILVRYKKHISVYARALEEYDIPFALSGAGESDYPELSEFLYLLQTVADPDNPVPLVATLRGLFYGVSDDELYRFKLAGGLFNFTIHPPDGAPEVIRYACDSLRLYRDWSRSLPATATLEKISTSLGLLPYALAGSMGKSRAGHLIQALEQLRRQEQSGLTDFSDAVAFLERHLADGAEEALDIEGGRAACVRIMNLHKAKGLEAPVVILANPGRKTEHRPSLHVTRVSGEPSAHICLRYKKDDYQSDKVLAEPTGWEVHAREEELYQRAEETRLLYVAATRAKNILVISTYPRKREKSAWYPLEDYLQQAEELSVPETPPLRQTIEAPPVTPAVLEQVKETQTLALARVIIPSYDRITVTAQSKTAETPERFHTGRGTAWGSMLHKALEVLVREEENVNLDEMVTSLVCGQGRFLAECEEVHKVLQEVTATPFWQRVRLATVKYTEVPFGLCRDYTCLTGTVDLAFRETDGWVLVDYKTDTIRDREHLDQLRKAYSPQITEYARRWEEITGERVKERGLFFTDGLRYCLINDSDKTA